MQITVLRGGPSAEREISLISGAAVADGLRQAGHVVFESDISPTELSGLDHPADVIFPVLHGAFGESGELQEILEQRRLRFVGSGSRASRIGIDKIATKEVWKASGLPTPAWNTVRRGETYPTIDGPCVVKAIGSGSSIDVFVCKAPAEAPANASAALAQVLARHDRALVEQFINGIELTVGILEDRALAPIRIVPKSEFFDFEAKYKSSETEHRFETGLPSDVVKLVQDLAFDAHNVVGCRDLSRVDVIVDNQNRPYLIEINTLPGFTPKSLLPEAAAHAGIPFAALVDRLARGALAREQ
ncbi:MAG TPA: D-alanine--D-alanine ligase [Tepidisphaeraceae bacterium]|nr:D-alanine--D-alanine ligase [Tepidisphaeraceae bacterium]